MIIAGFGRFGQIVARLLFANGMRAIVLDHDAEQVDLLRKFGYKVFYGDATRLDLLRAAGAGDACLLVNAIDDIGDSLALTDRVREHFPSLPIIARARKLGTFAISSRPEPDCCALFAPRHPALHANAALCASGEATLDVEALIRAALDGTAIEAYANGARDERRSKPARVTRR